MFTTFKASFKPPPPKTGQWTLILCILPAYHKNTLFWVASGTCFTFIVNISLIWVFCKSFVMVPWNSLDQALTACNVKCNGIRYLFWNETQTKHGYLWQSGEWLRGVVLWHTRLHGRNGEARLALAHSLVMDSRIERSDQHQRDVEPVLCWGTFVFVGPELVGPTNPVEWLQRRTIVKLGRDSKPKQSMPFTSRKWKITHKYQR